VKANDLLSSFQGMIMVNRIPASLRKLIEGNPPYYHDLPNLGKLVDCDLETLVKAYANAAAYHGKEGPLWGIWWRLQEHQGQTIPQAILEMSSQQLRWFSMWAFANNRRDEGAIAYRR
jgi:hypothetical protein